MLLVHMQTTISTISITVIAVSKLEPAATTPRYQVSTYPVLSPGTHPVRPRNWVLHFCCYGNVTACSYFISVAAMALSFLTSC